MYYAKWSSDTEIKNVTSKINFKEKVDKSGIPVLYSGDTIYTINNNLNSLVIGGNGSGKTQTVMLPTIRLTAKAGESIIINDRTGNIYETTDNFFTKNGYKTVILNFSDPSGNDSWNPLSTAYELYKNGKTSDAIKSIENVGHYFFNNLKDIQDPFWTTSTINFFVGVALYLFDNNKENEVNLNTIYSIVSTLENGDAIKNFVKQLDKSSKAYFYLSGTLNAPYETCASIMSVFNQNISKYVTYDTLSSMLSKDSFNITDIFDKKMAIFTIGETSDAANSLIPLFINQCIETANTIKNKKNINILLDDFDSLLPFKDFATLIDFSRSLNFKFTVAIKSYFNLINTYGKDNFEIIKLCFENIIYLISSDIYTLEEISKLCGNQLVDQKINLTLPLITVEELRTLKMFEAVMLISRQMPYRANLVPDYQIDWN